jgi:hypothetical protein
MSSEAAAAGQSRADTDPLLAEAASSVIGTCVYRQPESGASDIEVRGIRGTNQNGERLVASRRAAAAAYCGPDFD